MGERRNLVGERRGGGQGGLLGDVHALQQLLGALLLQAILLLGGATDLLSGSGGAGLLLVLDLEE